MIKKLLNVLIQPPVYISVREFLNSSISVMSASSWFVTWGICVQELTKYFDEIFFTLGISFISISPNSEWAYSNLFSSFLLIWTFSFWPDLLETNNLISFSITRPSLSVPCTLLISTPSSLANFLTFGDAGTIFKCQKIKQNVLKFAIN